MRVIALSTSSTASGAIRTRMQARGTTVHPNSILIRDKPVPDGPWLFALNLAWRLLDGVFISLFQVGLPLLCPLTLTKALSQ